MLVTQSPPITLPTCLRCRNGREARDTDIPLPRRLTSSAGCRRDVQNKRRCKVRRYLGQRQLHAPVPAPRTIALSGAGRFIYLSGDLGHLHHAEDIVTMANAYSRGATRILARNARPLMPANRNSRKDPTYLLHRRLGGTALLTCSK